jgi:hypothetical protein
MACAASLCAGTPAHGVVFDGATITNDTTVDIAWVQNGLTFANNASLETTGYGGGVDMHFYGTQSVTGDGRILLNSEHLGIHSPNTSTEAVLTIGPGVTVAAVDNSYSNAIEIFNGSRGTLVNDGTIDAGTNSISMHVNWTNNGTLRADGGGFDLTGSVVNNGVIDVANGGSIWFLNNLIYPGPAKVTNHGLLRVHNGSLGLGATYTVDELGTTDFYNVTFLGNGQTKPFGLDYTGHTLDINGSTGNVTFQGYGYFTGAVRTRDGAELRLTSDGPGSGAEIVLDDVSLDGTVRSSTANVYYRTTVRGTLTMAPSSLVSLKGALKFDGPTAAVSGSGEISAGSVTGDQFTIGSGVTLRSGDSPFTVTGTVTNNGTILLDRPGGTYTLGGPAWLNAGTIRLTAGTTTIGGSSTAFTNTGTIQADGATASLSFAGPNDGTLRASNGGSLTLSGTGFSNAGSVVAESGGSVTLASGPYPASLGSVAVNSGTLRIATPLVPEQLSTVIPTNATYAVAGNGVVDLQGGTLAHSPEIAWQLANGKFVNGTIATPLTSTGTIGTLDNVTLAADATVTTGIVTVLDSLGFANDATLSLEGGARLSFSGSQSITGSGQIAFNGASNVVTPNGDSGTTLTIGPSVTVKTGTGSGTLGFATLGLVNQGTLSARTPGQTLTVTGANWTNTGTLEAKNGGTLKLAGTFTTAGLGAFTTDTGGAIAVAGILDNTGSVIDLSATARLGIGGGTIRSGSITSADGTPFTAYPGHSFVDAVDVDAPIVLLPGASLGFGGTNRGGITGNGGVILEDAWSNPGSISVGAGGSVTIVPSNSMPSDFGSISLTDATLYLSTVMTTARLNTISRSNSLAVIQSELNNTGDILSITPAIGNVRLTGGSVVGGTVVTTGTAELQANTSACTLSGVTLKGNLTLLNGGIITVDPAGLTPVDAHISLAATTNTTSLTFFGNQTFGGTADVTFDGTSAPGTVPLNALSAGTNTLTIGPGITVRSRTNTGRIGYSSSLFGGVINDGVVSAQAPGRDLIVQGVSVGNHATFDARDGGALVVVTSRSFSNTGTVTVGTGSTLRVAGAGTLDNDGKIDLAGGTMIMDYTGTSAATLVRDQLATGRGNGSWTSATGITSALAAGDAQGRTAIGYAEASVLFGLTGVQRVTWSGQLVDATSVLLKVTSYGDANLDGTITADDFALIDKGYLAGLGTWAYGDFDYDGQVTSEDYLLMDRAYAQQTGTLSPSLLAQREGQFGPGYVSALVASVPEPAGAVLGAATLLAVGSRRRRSR